MEEVDVVERWSGKLQEAGTSPTDPREGRWPCGSLGSGQQQDQGLGGKAEAPRGHMLRGLGGLSRFASQ